MGMPEWAPANPAERELADALATGDGPELARVIQSATLLLPLLPEPGSVAESQVAEVLPADSPFIPVFTSVESLVWMFGDLIEEYETVDFATLLQRWPDTDHQLALNPGSPIATFLPPRAVADLANGTQSLTPVAEVEEALSDESMLQIRRLCLRELAGGAHPDAAHPDADDGAPLRDDPPENAMEIALREAVAEPDGQAYLHALLSGEPVIVPTAQPVPDPDQIFEDDFPWRVLGGDQAQVITVFTSPGMWQRTGAGDAPHLAVDFLHVLANWPSEDHLLYVDPGSVLELLLTGDMVLEIIASMSEALAEAPPGGPPA